MTTPEVIPIPGIFGLSNALGESVVATLVTQERLPKDIYFRSLALDPETREVTVTADVLAALGLGEGSEQAATYLRGPLPDCVYVPEPGKLHGILTQIDADYYRRFDLYPNPHNLDESRTLVRYTWQRLVQHLNPRMYSRVAEALHPVNVQRSSRQQREYAHGQLGRVVIRDEALLGMYMADEKVPGIGPAGRELIRHMLADNHPRVLQSEDYFVR